MTEAVQEQRENQEKQRKPWGFQPGQSGNPGGRPKGSRNKLQGDFFKALAEDFAEHGKAAIIEARADDPVGYLKIVASLMPKELQITPLMQEFTDEQLDAALLTARTILDAKSVGSGDSGPGETQSPSSLQTVSETI